MTASDLGVRKVVWLSSRVFRSFYDLDFMYLSLCYGHAVNENFVVPPVRLVFRRGVYEFFEFCDGPEDLRRDAISRGRYDFFSHLISTWDVGDFYLRVPRTTEIQHII